MILVIMQVTGLKDIITWLCWNIFLHLLQLNLFLKNIFFCRYKNEILSESANKKDYKPNKKTDIDELVKISFGKSNKIEETKKKINLLRKKLLE